jgi:3-oxoacyl-[acyl-carrier protein] reductase
MQPSVMAKGDAGGGTRIAIRLVAAVVYPSLLRSARHRVRFEACQAGVLRAVRIIRGRKALVTGAAFGIGRAIALELAREGAELFLIDIDAENLERVAAEARRHGVTVIAEVCDLADPAAISASVGSLRAHWDALNILINNAGVSYYGSTETMREDQWRRIMAVNLMAPMQLFHELLPLLLAADEAHVLNVCSMFGLAPWRKAAVYQTSKYGLVGFTAALRTEFHGEQFGVTALCPGFVRTSLLEASLGDRAALRTPPAWISTTPEALAVKAIKAIRRNRGLVLITPAAHIYWRFARLAPGLVDWLLREGWRTRNRIKVQREGT